LTFGFCYGVDLWIVGYLAVSLTFILDASSILGIMTTKTISSDYLISQGVVMAKLPLVENTPLELIICICSYDRLFK
jgi:hypothetical protein